MGYVVGVDIGGTFTDVSVINIKSRREVLAKTPTTPDDLLDGLIKGIEMAAEEMGLTIHGLLAETVRFSHATTQTTNLMFTWVGGATVGLLTTRGFADELLIMRARGRVAGLSLAERRHLRATDKPRQIVPRERIVEISERIDRTGQILEPLDQQQVADQVAHLIDQGVDSFAVSLLWAHQNPRHEQSIRDIVRSVAPDAHVSLSSEIAPVTGEYERTSTTVVNAYVAPTLERYLQRLSDRLTTEGLSTPVLVFQAGGGVSDTDSTLPVSTIESGPAAGMVAVQKLATGVRQSNVIATDVGGTTFKVGLVVDGRWTMATETVVNQYVLLSPMIDIVSIGAGGGSVAWVDQGRLRIGPESAGAAPGPACYGWGGDRPTVTDADVLLGYLAPERPLSGGIALRPDLAEEAMRQHVADELFGGDVIAAAAGVRQVVDSQMGDLIRKATLERGYDPREFIIAAYGGAGPVHAASYARSAGVERIMVPLSATAFSAFGVVVSDLVQTSQRSIGADESRDVETLRSTYKEVIDKAAGSLATQGINPSSMNLVHWADMRYERQLHHVRVILPDQNLDSSDLLEVMTDAFRARYQVLFGSTAMLKDAIAQVLRVGVDAVAPNGIDMFENVSDSLEAREVQSASFRDVYWPHHGGWGTTSTYDGESLKAGDTLHGPAVVDNPGTTVTIPPEAIAVVDEARNLMINLEPNGVTS